MLSFPVRPLLVHKRQPTAMSYSDEHLMGCIRRVNLDLMWSREKGTISNTLAAINKGRTMSIELGLVPQPVKLGPWPLGDGKVFKLPSRCLELPRRKAKTTQAMCSLTL